MTEEEIDTSILEFLEDLRSELRKEPPVEEVKATKFCFKRGIKIIDEYLRQQGQEE